jgi:hypothetical protein
MREYTAIVTITVIASVMAESEHDAEDRCSGYRLGKDARSWYVPPLMHPHVIGLAAFRPISVAFGGFKARSFTEAYRDVEPDMEPGCEAAQVVFPPGHPALQADGDPGA